MPLPGAFLHQGVRHHPFLHPMAPGIADGGTASLRQRALRLLR